MILTPSAVVLSITAGFPRIGGKREMKVALEKYWAGKLRQDELLEVSHAVQQADWQKQAEAGITRVGIDGTLYDQILDTTFLLGTTPTRFKDYTGLQLYFAMARGGEGTAALDMSKFFDTNYHYLVRQCCVVLVLVRCTTADRLVGFQLRDPNRTALVTRGQNTLASL